MPWPHAVACMVAVAEWSKGWTGRCSLSRSPLASVVRHGLICYPSRKCQVFNAKQHAALHPRRRACMRISGAALWSRHCATIFETLPRLPTFETAWQPCGPPLSSLCWWFVRRPASERAPQCLASPRRVRGPASRPRRCATAACCRCGRCRRRRRRCRACHRTCTCQRNSASWLLTLNQSTALPQVPTDGPAYSRGANALVQGCI